MATSGKSKEKSWSGSISLRGGFPCQDVSQAGKRAGIEESRSGLWFEYARLVGVVLGAERAGTRGKGMETYQRAVDLQPKQEQLLNWLEESGEATATVLGLGGSRGSSKSAACRRAAIVLAMKYEKIVVYIVRRVLGDVLENHMEKIALEFPWVHQYYRPGDYEYDLPNGSRIVFVYAENPIDVKRVSYGPECTFLFIDQAEQFSEDELLSFRICNRWPAMKKETEE